MDKKLEKKYIPLAEFFKNCTQSQIKLTFEAIQNIMGQDLPNAAYLNASWWKKTKPPLTHFLAWVDSEYYVVDVKLGHAITFSKLKHKQSNDTSKQKHTFIIRQIESDDARNYINLLNKIYGESPFEYYSKDEIDLTVQYIRKTLTEWRKNKNSNVFICIVDGNIAGYAEVLGNHAPKKRHVATVRIGVIEQFQHIGMGNALLNYAEKWATNHSISRLQAYIHSQNTHAIKLFSNQKYILESTLQNAFLTDESFADELLLAKLL